MTREEAILVLDHARPQTAEVDKKFYDDEDLNNALNMGIEAVKQEPCEDCIDRAEAMTEIQMNARKYTMAREFDGTGQVEWSDYLISIKDALDILRKLPPITLTCKKGEEEE